MPPSRPRDYAAVADIRSSPNYAAVHAQKGQLRVCCRRVATFLAMALLGRYLADYSWTYAVSFAAVFALLSTSTIAVTTKYFGRGGR
jgi:hypothetical protein